MGDKTSMLGKNVLDRKTLRDIEKLDSNERVKVMNYKMISALKKKNEFFTEEVFRLEKEGRDTFIVKNKLARLPGKIKALEIRFDEEHFKKTVSLVNGIQKELENV